MKENKEINFKNDSQNASFLFVGSKKRSIMRSSIEIYAVLGARSVPGQIMIYGLH